MLKTEARAVTQDLIHVVGGTCDNCGTALKTSCVPSLIGTRNNDCFADVLTIKLIGQYNGYFDDADRVLMFCHQCADKLAEAFPCVKRVIEDPQEGQIA